MRIGRSAAVGALALTATVALASCSAGASGDSPANVVPELADDQQVEIVFESYNLAQAGVMADTVNELIADFEAEHPNITVKGQPPQGDTSGGNYTSSVQTQVLAGNAPDVAQLTFDALDYTVNQLGAKPLADLVGEEELETHFGGDHPFHDRAGVLADWDGETYGMPYVFSTPVLFYNATALEEAGVPADPDLSTWDKVEKVAAQVSESTGEPAIDVSCLVKGGNWCMQGLFRSNGARVLSDDRKTIEFGSAEAVDTVGRFADMYEDGVLRNGDYNAQMEGFQKGEVPLVLTTSALQGMYMQAAADGGWELKAAAMPAFDGKDEAVPTNSGSALFILSDDPAEQRAAWEFISFMTSDHAYEQISSKIGYLPLRTGLATEEDGALHEWAQSNPLIAPNLEQIDRMEPWVSYPGNSYLQVEDILATGIEESVYYGEDPEQTMDDAAERAQELIG